MAKRQRLVVGSSGLRPVERRPAARVRDEFVPGAAARGASSDLEQVARGLGQLAPNLTQFAISLQEKRRQEGIAAGRARFEELAQEQEDFGEAMRKGLVEAKDNPFFRAGLLEAAGRIAADRYGDELRVAHAQMPDKTDFGSFDKMASELFEQHREALGDVTGNELFAAAFNNRTQAHRASERANFANGLSGALLEQRADQLYAEIANAIDIGLDNDLPVEAVGAEITRLLDMAYTQGMNGTQINMIAGQALKAAATELASLDPNNALEILDGLGESVLSGPQADGKRTALTRTRQGDALINEAREAASAIIQRNYRFADYQQAQEMQLQTNEIYTAALGAMLDANDPTAVDLSPFIANMREINPTAAATLVSLQASLGEGAFRTDEAVFNRAFNRLMNGDPSVTPQYVGGLVDGRLLTVQDGLTLINAYHQMQADGGASDRDPIFQNTLNDINRGFQDTTGVLGGARGEAANRAEASLYHDYLTAKASGEYEALAPSQRVEWLRERAAHWIKYYGGGDLIASELEGKTVQAFIGGTVDPTKFVVLTEQQVQRWMAGIDTDAAIAMAARYGFSPAQLDQFLSIQFDLMSITATLPESGGGPTTTESQ